MDEDGKRRLGCRRGRDETGRGGGRWRKMADSLVHFRNSNTDYHDHWTLSSSKETIYYY